MDGLYWKILLKWMIWGYPYFWKHPNHWISFARWKNFSMGTWHSEWNHPRELGDLEMIFFATCLKRSELPQGRPLLELLRWWLRDGLAWMISMLRFGMVQNFGGSLWGGLSRLLKAFRQEYVGLAQTLGAQRCSLPIDRPEHEDGNEWWDFVHMMVALEGT